MTAIARDFTVDFVVSDLRNGAAQDIVAIVPSPAIPIAYQWLTIGGIPDDRRLPFAEMYVRIYFVALSVRFPDESADMVRKKAIVLAGVRVGMMVFWNIRNEDLSTGERGPGYVTYQGARDAVAAGGTPEAPVPAVVAVAEGVVAAFGGGTANAAGAAWDAFVELSAAELEVLKWHIVLSPAIVPAQGYSIVKTGHHFLSNVAGQSRNIYNGLKRQWLSKASDAVRAWVESASAWWEDVAFHKAGHPIKMDTKKSIAMDPDTKAKMTAVDFGSIAIRLPATPPELEYAKLAKAVLDKTAGILIASGAEIRYTTFTTLLENIEKEKSYNHRMELVTQAVAAAHSVDATLAIAAGVLLHLTEDGAGSTITKSYGFKRLAGEYPAEVNMGRQIVRAYSSRQRDAIANGENIKMILVI